MATIVIVLVFPLHVLKVNYLSPPVDSEPVASFVGGDKCESCHEEIYGKWRNSHHDKAMDVADEDNVLGDFTDAVFEYDGVTTRFYRKGKKFFVHTEGPDGEMDDFEITYVFGVYPLQQYLVPFPGGRLQCLTIAWDVEKKEWFRLPPYEITGPNDWLHWTKAGQNWNGMCAECHSTHLRKGYDHNNRTYQTGWTEIDVSCEACHGPGSLHIEWADKPPMARTPSEDYELVIQTSRLNSREQVELCARCHSRRILLGDYNHGGNDLMDNVVPALLREELYYPDGQILDEVYVYGSFVQSTMYRNRVRCSDCHDMHSLRRLKEGNDLCLQCHRADTYDTKDHHFHQKTYKGQPSEGASCVKCHMPGRYYMGIDYRVDHSMRVPRPDLSVELDVPNSCNTSECHGDRTYQWAAQHFAQWYGISRKPHYGTVLAAARKGVPEVHADLLKVAEDRMNPVLVRATALFLLGSYPGEESAAVLERALSDDEALIRHTAVRYMNPTEPRNRIRLMAPLLRDPVKAVRLEAARSLAVIPPGQLNAKQRDLFQSALLEYQRALEYSADFPASSFNLGNLYTDLGNPDLAEQHFNSAIELDDQFHPAKMNLAMLYTRIGKNNEAEVLIREVLRAQPELYEAAYSLGLLLAEEKRFEEAAEYLEKAAKGLPQRARIHYNLGLLLQHLGRHAEAEEALLTSIRIEPGNMDYLYALAVHYLRRGKLLAAKRIAEQMVAKNPSSRLGLQLLDVISRQLKSKN